MAAQSALLSPYLTVSDAAGAIAFYKAAFQAQEVARLLAPGSTNVMHARLAIHGCTLMLADDFPAFHEGRSFTPQAFGGSPVILHLQLPDVQAVWAQAVAAGAEVVMPLAEQFWGDLYGQLRDPFGHTWALGQTVHALTPEQMAERIPKDMLSR